jgi:integrase
LASFFQFAVAQQVIETNPVIGSDRPGVLAGDPSATLMLGTDFVERYLGAARFDDRLYAIASLLACEGLKLGEALALDTEHVTGRASSVVLRVHRAGGMQRVVLGRRTSLAVHRCAGGRRHEPLFVSKPQSATTGTRRRLTRFGADHLFKQVPGSPSGAVTSNALRRYYIHTAAESGTPIDAISRQAGIGDRRSTRRYLTATTPAAVVSGREISQETPADHGSDRRSTNKEV